MKTAFKILPAVTADKRLHLLIEIGWEGASFIYYSTDSLKIEGLVIMQAEKNITAADLTKEIEQELQAELAAEFESCHICYNFKETILVPASYFNESEVGAMMDCVTGIQADSITFTAPLNELNATNIFRVNADINNILHTKFPAAHFHHTHTLLFPLLQQELPYMTPAGTVVHGATSIALVKNDKGETEQLIVQINDTSEKTQVNERLQKAQKMACCPSHSKRKKSSANCNAITSARRIRPA